MFITNKRPFNWLPLNQGDLFDLTCEYTIFLLDRINGQYYLILQKAEEITKKMPTPNDASLYIDLFALTDGFLDNYSKLVKCAKLSLGENVGTTKSKQKIFSDFSYSPNKNYKI